MDMLMGVDTAMDEEKEMLLQQLSRGIEDMEDGRELPLDEAFKKITELRDARHKAWAGFRFRMANDK